MGMEAFFGPATLKAGLIAFGLEAARLDYHEQTHRLYGTILQHGRAHTFAIPLGRTYTRDEICELLTRKPEPDAIAQAPTIAATSPP
jgi:hypothetical protein